MHSKQIKNGKKQTMKQNNILFYFAIVYDQFDFDDIWSSSSSWFYKYPDDDDDDDRFYANTLRWNNLIILHLFAFFLLSITLFFLFYQKKKKTIMRFVFEVLNFHPLSHFFPYLICLKNLILKFPKKTTKSFTDFIF